MADVALGLMTLVNVYAIVLLTPTIVNLTKDYQEKLKFRQSLTFNQSEVDIQGQIEPGVWR
jgi:AGCS family alanine or glycine:cation symporter